MIDTIQIAGPIEAYSDGSFERMEHGPMAVQYPIFDRLGQVIDEVAWFPNAPRTWWQRKLIVDVLGETDISKAGVLNAPLVLLESPSQWLRSNFRFSACILNWECDARFLFGGVAEIQCASTALEQKLLRRIRECSQASFTVSVLRHDRSAAA